MIQILRSINRPIKPSDWSIMEMKIYYQKENLLLIRGFWYMRKLRRFRFHKHDWVSYDDKKDYYPLIFLDSNLSFVKFGPFNGNTVNCCQQPIAHCLTWMWIVKIFLYVQQLCNIFPLFLSVDYKSSTSSNIWWIIIMQCFVVGTNNVVTTADKPPNKNAYFICTNYLVRKTCYI